MDFATFIRIALTIDVMLIGYGQAQRYEGSPCTLYDGSRGICKNIAYCESIKVGLRTGTIGYHNIVTCSFQGAIQIACCADERPQPGRHRPVLPSQPNTDFVFIGTRPGRVTDKPPLDDTRSRYSAGRKAESACEIYSRLPIAISWNILDGVPTNLGEFPWMAALGYRDINNDISYDCGGTLISEYYVLTAAHCAPPRRRPQVVRLGKVTLFTNDDDAVPVDIDIADTIRHPQYNSGVKKNDIALVRLARPVNFTENVRPACLRTNLGDVLPTVELIITGWGTTSATRTIRPSVLLKANVTSMPLQLCNTTLVSINRQANEPGLRQGLSESQCCAFDPAGSKDACQGDSGGPLQSFPDTTNIASIIGVVSFGVGCGTKQPSVYTRVAYYLDWIEPIVWPNA